jgi:hypothetical protein
MIMYAVAAVPTAAIRAIGRNNRNTLMPHACIATNSRSADSRPNPTRMPRSSAIGIVMLSAWGSSVSRMRATIDHSTPFATSASASRRIGGISRTNVRTISPSASGSRISRIR